MLYFYVTVLFPDSFPVPGTDHESCLIIITIMI